jgi:predicted PurR-regulated permease PerM
MFEHRESNFIRQLLIVVGVVALTFILLFTLWQTIQALLLLFAAVLLAILLDGAARWLSQHTPLSRLAALALVVTLVVGLLIAAIWLAIPTLSEQANQLSQNLGEAGQAGRAWLEQRDWGQFTLRRLSALEEGVTGQPATADAARFFARLGQGITGLIVILFTGLLLAIEPSLYLNGLLRLVPPSRRGRARQVLQTVGQTLYSWLLSRLIAMIIVGVLTIAGLLLLRIPLAVLLGLIAGLLSFIPIIGAILAIIPALIIALAAGPQQALYVLLLYLAIQAVETYLITPWLTEEEAGLPAALTIISQVAGGFLFGSLGITLGPPLAAVLVVLVKMLYVEDLLGDRSAEPIPSPQKESAATTRLTDKATKHPLPP